jgi:hypothetical protein
MVLMTTGGETGAQVWHQTAEPLLELHGELRLRFQELREQRDYGRGAVRLIEHGLDREELALLIGAVREALDEHDLEDRFWTRRYLPLCVVATEIGYKYQGTGTDYWPKLSREVDSVLGHAERHALREYFNLAERLTGVVPPPTSWAAQFHLIAWPISHALFPIELHSKLLQALVRHPGAILRSSTTEEIIDPIRAWAARADHQKLLSFLELGEPAAAIVRHFLSLDDPSRSVAPAFLARVSEDLRQSTGALRDLRDARRRQRIFRSRATRAHPEGAPTHDALPPTWAPFTLEPSFDGLSAPTLLVSPPMVPSTVATPHLDGLGPRARARLLRGARVGVAELVAGQPIELRLRSVPDPEDDGGVSLVTDLPPDLPRQLTLHVQRARVDVRRPLLFADHVGPASGAGQVRTRACYSGATWWLLGATGRPSALPPGVTSRGEVAGLRVFRIAPGCEEDFTWLEAQGIEREHRAVVRLVGSPSWAGPCSETMRLGSDDLLLVLVADGQVRVEPEADSLLPGAYALSLDGASGRRSLRLIDQGDVQEAVPVEIIEPSEPEEVVHLALEAPDLTVESLRRRQVGLRLRGELPFVGLTVRMRLEADGLTLARAATTTPEPLPCTIPASDRCWQAVQEMAYMVTDAPLRLIIEVGAVACGSWVFEPGGWAEPLAAPMTSDGEVSATGEMLLSPERPHWPLPDGAARPAFLLTQPVREGDRSPLAGMGTLRAPRQLTLLDRPVPSKPRLLRRLDAGAEPASVDGWTLVRTWIAWGTAVGEGLLAESVRRDVARTTEAWLVELLCGARWAQAERALPALQPPPLGAMFAGALARVGLGRDEVVDDALLAEGSPVDPERLRVAWADIFQERRELLRELADAEEDDPGFDLVCADLNRAYVVATGRHVDADIYLPPDELKPLISDTVARWEEQVWLSSLLPHLRPRWLARSLSEVGFPGLDRAGLVAELASRLREKRGAPLSWEAAWVEALVVLFTQPGRFPLDDLGRHTVSAAIIDQSAARAIRYATLRWAMADSTSGRGEVL